MDQLQTEITDTKERGAHDSERDRTAREAKQRHEAEAADKNEAKREESRREERGGERVRRKRENTEEAKRGRATSDLRSRFPDLDPEGRVDNSI